MRNVTSSGPIREGVKRPTRLPTAIMSRDGKFQVSVHYPSPSRGLVMMLDEFDDYKDALKFAQKLKREGRKRVQITRTTTALLWDYKSPEFDD